MYFESIPRGLKQCVEPARGVLTSRVFWLALAVCTALWILLGVWAVK